MTVFQAVKELRRRLGLTQQELAHRTGLAIRTVNVYETGKTATSDGVLFRFARLAIEQEHKDLAEILTPGRSVQSIIDVIDLDQLIEELEKAEAKFREFSEKAREAELAVREATDKLKRRLSDCGFPLYLPGDPKQSIFKQVKEEKK
jgi:transcriptional regulator with XRE-family HTH domain